MSLPDEDGYHFGPEGGRLSEKRLRETLDTVAEQHAEHFVVIREDDSMEMIEVLLGGEIKANQPDKLVDISITILALGERLITTVTAHNEKYEITDDAVSYASEPLRSVYDWEIEEIDFWLEQASWDKSHSQRMVDSLQEFDNLSA